MLRKTAWALAGALVAGLAVAGCGGDDDDDDVSNGPKEVKVGDLTFADTGTEDVMGDKELKLAAQDFAFSPTFVRGDPGQKLKVVISNDSANTHNFNTGTGGLDKDIAKAGKEEVEVTFPQSGGLVFFCKYHAKQGMNGGLLAGKASPQDLKASAPGGPGGPDYGY